ncbi:MAG: hypothetical protein H7259_09415 [Cytophagales bacterium]|nr:hypothetical protein [Cytophaga sp.]
MVKGQVEIPMEGKITKLVLLDTIKGMTYPEISIGKKVTVLNAGFLVSIDNGFPMDAMLQMYFLDSTNVIIDSLFAKGPQLILSGQIDANGKVTSSTHTLMKELFNEQRYSRITKTKNAALYVFFRTANNGTVPVKIYPSYKIKSNIAIDVKADVSF